MLDWVRLVKSFSDDTIAPIEGLLPIGLLHEFLEPLPVSKDLYAKRLITCDFGIASLYSGRV